MTPWNRPEDAEARALFKEYLQTKLEEVADSLDITDTIVKITAEDYSYTPEIFNEVSEEEAYEIYWASVVR
jgi:vacuolar-type H+-ATPase subunit E/Vma4